MKKNQKKEKPEDKVAIVLKSLIMILTSRGFMSKVTADTLIEYLQSGSKEKPE